MTTVPKPSETTTELSLLGRRDAFHVPGILVKAAKNDRNFYGGAEVCFTDSSLTEVTWEFAGKPHALVDPFLRGLIPADTLFWVFPLPGTVQNLVHQFEISLPGLETVPPVAAPAEETLEELQKTIETLTKERDELNEELDENPCRGCY